MNEIDEPQIGTVLAGKYRLDDVMRETEFGFVYRATHTMMEKPLIVKVLAPALAVDETIVARFSQEARQVSGVSHPNILNVTDFGSDSNGVVYIVYEDAAGSTLRTLIDEYGKCPADQAVKIGKQIAAGLSAAHAKGLIHGHLTSDSVLVSEDLTVKLLDLGTAVEDVESSVDESASRSLSYLSPEQCADALAADARSDIYAAGVILYEMLAGELPFRAASTSELMLKQAQEPPPPLGAFRDDLPPALEPLVLQTLAKNPEMRHQTAAELFDDLNRIERLIGQNPAPAMAGAAAAGLTGNNNIWKTAFVVLAGISLLALFLIWSTSSKQTDPSTVRSDANSQPVQPINPATGMNEQSLATIVPSSTEMMSNANLPLTMPDQLPGGDGYNPWANGVKPPPGAPYPVGAGQYVDPSNPNSQFMSNDGLGGGKIVQGPDGNYYYIVDTPVTDPNAKPTPTPKPGKSPAANTAVTEPTPTSGETPKTPTTTGTPETATPKASPTPKPATTPKPASTPKSNATPKPPAASSKPGVTGKTEDS